MPASEILSSARVAPRSVIRATDVSAMTCSIVVAEEIARYQVRSNLRSEKFENVRQACGARYIFPKVLAAESSDPIDRMHRDVNRHAL